MSKDNKDKKVAYAKPAIANTSHMARKLLPLYREWVAAGRPARVPRPT